MNVNRSIRKYSRQVALTLLFFFMFQIVTPVTTLALTSGPSQPEFQEFEQSSTTEMVDPFTGDFTYNIPLFELPGPNGGYPFNLSYHGGVTMDQEASWVGLGWTLNAGAITRQVRGIPDEFRGEVIETTKKMKPNRSWGVGAGLGAEFFGSDQLSARLGFTTIFNNYHGISYSIDGNLGYPAISGSHFASNVRLGFSLNTQEGLSLQPSFNLFAGDQSSRNELSAVSIGAGYHSRYGLTDLSFGIYPQKRKSFLGEKLKAFDPLNQSYGASLSLASNGFTPVVHTPMLNVNAAFKFKGGAAWQSVFPNSHIKGFTSVQNFKEQDVSTRAFGYKYLQEAGEDDLLDFNREGDGIIHEEAPNLPLPVLMHDIYSISGQGIGSMFRPLRNDVGVVYDNANTSTAISTSLGVDVGPVSAHVGGNFGLMFGTNSSGKWNFRNPNPEDGPVFSSFTNESKDEPWYYKVRGEHTSMLAEDYSALNGERAVGISFVDQTNDADRDITAIDPQVNFSSSLAPSLERDERASNVVAVSNEELTNVSQADPQDVVALLKVDGLNRNRENYPKDHVGGYITTNTDGIRYVYALPVYNRSKEEVIFGPDGGSGLEDADQITTSIKSLNNNSTYYTSTKTPAYAHSYLLTGVVGPDYVDVGNDGIDQKDLGYWVKFNYEKVGGEGSKYYWKTPAETGLAFYNRGHNSDPDDDRGTYEVGDKEIWYLKNVETKTHTAEFNTLSREDNRGAVHPQLGASAVLTRRLTNVELFPKDAAGGKRTESLLKVNFEQDYELCKNTPNSIAAGGGKLTLKSISFEYGSSRKKLNNYKFGYGDDNADYQLNSTDRWGVYKTDSEEDADNRDFPFVDQSSPEQLAVNAGMWSLKKIELPSGGTIDVEYEMDDYAYVQHKRAMEMVPITNGTLYDPNAEDLPPSSNPFRVNFNGELATKEQILEALNGEDVYFKALVQLTGGSEKEYVSGYFGVEEVDGQGFVICNDNPVNLDCDNKQFYHPIAERAWQHIRTNQPRLINDFDIPSGNVVPFLKLLAVATREVRQVFRGFSEHAVKQGWANKIDPTRSWVRLPVVDGIKYGGGHRVKRVLIQESEGGDTYGQVYDYRMMENGQMISSGVAANEPIVGGEESPLRQPKKFTQSVPLHSNNNLFFEYPINQGSYPGAGVGYRKVTVMSLASNEKSTGLFSLFSDVNYSTTGKTEYEFYTAKDFPVVTHETTKKTKKRRRWIPIPFIGVNSESYHTASQGYSIVTNDMHGKLKRQSQFRQLADGSFDEAPFAYTSYKYRTHPSVYQNEKILVTNNYFQSDGEHILKPAAVGVGDRVMGVEQEVVVDARKYKDQSFQGGFDFNMDVLFAGIPIPVPTAWPNVSRSLTELKTLVSNKIVFRAGILEEVETFQEGAKVNTTYEAWDALTGRPILSKIQDQFENSPTYTYTIPAYTQYERMGPAYKNLGFRFRLSGLYQFPEKGQYEYEAHVDERHTTGAEAVLIPGDEVIFRREIKPEVGPATYVPEGTGIYLGVFSGSPRFYSSTDLQGQVYEAIVIRSGNRNHLTTDAGQVTGLRNPIDGAGSEVEFSKEVVVPIDLPDQQ